MRKHRTIEMDMVHGPLYRNLVLFSLPLMAANLLQMAFNAADTIVVGKFSGQRALAAVGATAPIINLIVSLFAGLAIGANIVIARAIGKGDRGEISIGVNTGYWLSIVSGILLTVFGMLLSPMLLKAMGTPDDIISLSVLYLRIYFLGAIPLLIYDFGSAALRARGDTLHPTIYLCISGVLNVVLNLFFVIILHHSVDGVAMATVISEAVSAVLVSWSLAREADETKLVPALIRFHREETLQILKVGIPAGLQSMMWAISNIAVQSSLNTFGSVVVAGNSAAQSIESFVYIGMEAFSQAAITFTSQNAGAGEKKQIRRLLIVLSVMMFVVSFGIGAVLTLTGRYCLRLYTNDEAVIRAGMVRMRFVVFWLFLNGLLDVPASSLRGMGYGTLPTVIMLAGIVGIRLLYIATIFQAMPTLDVLYFCFPLSWAITLVLQYGFWIYAYRRF
ncbi:MAG: MATE family efflux transporter [Erysipelotrichaceae bacterium]|nr:MATE family efflux transporter [Erysipelotrichaceae bacterium]